MVLSTTVSEQFIGRSFNIQNFKSRIEHRGVQRNSKFLVKFQPPPGVLAFNNNVLKPVADDMMFWTDATQIPGVSLSLRQVLRYGYGTMEKKPVAPVFNDIKFSVMNDEASQNFSFFQQWIEYICRYDADQAMGDNTTTYELRYKNEYMTNINVIEFDQSGNQSLNILLHEAYPVVITEMPVNWQDTTNIQRFEISFTFLWWVNTQYNDSDNLDPGSGGAP